MASKLKTRKSAAKRFKVTGSGKIVFCGAGHRHHMEKKSSRRKRRQLSLGVMSKEDSKNVKALLPYIK